MRTRDLICAATLAVAACARAPAPPAPPATVHSVAVFPPSNLTGDELLVEGGSLLEKYVFRVGPVTVGDVLAAEARLQLASRGLTVVAPQIVADSVGDHPPSSVREAAKQAARSQIDAAVLFIQIRRWEPDVPFHPSFIIVSLAASLVDPADGRVLWIDDLPSRPIPTRGVVNPGEASIIAAAKVMEDLLAGFGAVRPAS